MNLLRIPTISILVVIVAFSCICNAESENIPAKSKEKLKDSRILRIQPAPVKHRSMYSKHEQPHMQHLEKSRNSEKKSHLTNKQLMSKLGLAKVRVPSSHGRKRLAVESRHHARPDDSHMFIVKLPPNPYYYTNSKPAGDFKNSIDDNGKKVSFGGFQSNGKPGRIYHWNIPVLKKIIGDDSRSPSYRKSNDVSSLIDIKNIPTWSKPWENETIDKTYGKLDSDEGKSLKKKKSPSYYVPAKPKKNNFNKYFPGNGKPKGFYVIQKSHKPAYYQKLIP